MAVTTMMGTERNMPGMPQIMPQNVTEPQLIHEHPLTDILGKITDPGQRDCDTFVHKHAVTTYGSKCGFQR